jgi:uncharacterized glyoxalase superfamily protein PhnB
MQNHPVVSQEQWLTAPKAMRETFFAHRFAMLRDKFGTFWMIINERTPAQGD